MNRSIQVAAVQLDVRPDSIDARLYRADQILCDAVELGAELVVLPELFNTGYVYSDENFRRAEQWDGPTVTWMKHAAHRAHVHLAGSLLLKNGSDIFNTMLIVSPDGRTWRYDKSYPWGWERGYFRENQAGGSARAVVAHTDLGDLGMLICWDIGHPELWQAYAGQVDMMVVCSCPPSFKTISCHLPDGTVLSAEQMGAAMSKMMEECELTFAEMFAEQTAWMGVPAVNSVGCGTFESPIPNGRATLMGLIPSSPALARYLPQANGLSVRAKLVDSCRILSAQGETLAQRAQSRGEGFTCAEVPLPESKRLPAAPQPPSRISKTTYFLSDTILPGLMKSTYEHGRKKG